jgi:hypothetical protein
MRRIPLLCFTFLALTGLTGNAYAAHDQVTTPILETADSRKACEDPLIENPFTQFGDYADYVLAPDGNFDASVAGWQFSGGAQVVETDKGRSLKMPEKAVAISPSMCLDLHFPHFRMYHKTVKDLNGEMVLGKLDKSEIKVEVVYLNVDEPKWKEIEKFRGKDGFSATSDYKLSKLIELKPDRGGKLPGARQAALRFTVIDAERGESVLLDDIYVDPKRR